MPTHGKYRGEYDSRRPTRNENIVRRRLTASAMDRLALDERAERLAASASRWSERTGKPVRIYLDRIARAKKCRFLRVANMARKVLIDRINAQLFAQPDLTNAW